MEKEGGSIAGFWMGQRERECPGGQREAGAAVRTWTRDLVWNGKKRRDLGDAEEEAAEFGNDLDGQQGRGQSQK